MSSEKSTSKRLHTGSFHIQSDMSDSHRPHRSRNVERVVSKLSHRVCEISLASPACGPQVWLQHFAPVSFPVGLLSLCCLNQSSFSAGNKRAESWDKRREAQTHSHVTLSSHWSPSLCLSPVRPSRRRHRSATPGWPTTWRRVRCQRPTCRCGSTSSRTGRTARRPSWWPRTSTMRRRASSRSECESRTSLPCRWRPSPPSTSTWQVRRGEELVCLSLLLYSMWLYIYRVYMLRNPAYAGDKNAALPLLYGGQKLPKSKINKEINDSINRLLCQ